MYLFEQHKLDMPMLVDLRWGSIIIQLGGHLLHWALKFYALQFKRMVEQTP